MNSETGYSFKIFKSIVSIAKSIVEIKNLEIFKSILYSKSNVEKVHNILLQFRLSDLDYLPIATMDQEMIIIVKFVDQVGRMFIATLYDNDELWQDPEVINIYSIIDGNIKFVF
jgi:hypothetical protein